PASDAPRLPGGHIESEQNRRGRVDRHARAHPIEGQAVEQGLHVLDGGNGDADAPYLASGHRRVAVVAHLSRQVERDAEALVPLREEALETSVRLLRGAETGVLTHRPQTTAAHRRPDPARQPPPPGDPK